MLLTFTMGSHRQRVHTHKCNVEVIEVANGILSSVLRRLVPAAHWQGIE